MEKKITISLTEEQYGLLKKAMLNGIYRLNDKKDADADAILNLGQEICKQVNGHEG